MDSKHEMYERFTETMIDSFHDFLCKLEQSDCRDFACHFVDKLGDIKATLKRLLEKTNSSRSNVEHRNEIPTIPPKTSPHVVVQKNGSIDSDNGDGSDIFERAKKYIRLDIEGSSDGDSDCSETKSEPSFAQCWKDSFGSDYPDKSSHRVMSSSESPIDNPFIRKITPNTSNVGRNENANDPDDPYIVRVSDEVYKCEICSINHLSSIDAKTHIRGRQHSSKLAKFERHERKLESKEIDSWIRIPKIENVPIFHGVYTCTLCETTIMGVENALKHLEGRKHIRQLQKHQSTREHV